MTFQKKINVHRIQGLFEIELDPFYDERGEIWTPYSNVDWLPEFVEDKITISKKNVLRGFHGDSEIHKLISCFYGEFLLVVADFRTGSESHGQILKFNMSHKKPKSIFVPAGCVNAHLCLSDECIFYYKWSRKYNSPENQITIKWDDSFLNIDWPIKNPILSKRDQNGKSSKGVYL
jgi:dTDP-4-dehydrorhamnose 3,5-epimerase